MMYTQKTACCLYFTIFECTSWYSMTYQCNAMKTESDMANMHGWAKKSWSVMICQIAFQTGKAEGTILIIGPWVCDVLIQTHIAMKQHSTGGSWYALFMGYGGLGCPKKRKSFWISFVNWSTVLLCVVSLCAKKESNPKMFRPPPYRKVYPHVRKWHFGPVLVV